MQTEVPNREGRNSNKREAPIHVHTIEIDRDLISILKKRRIWMHRIAVFGPLLFLALVIWLDEVLDIPHMFFGMAPTPVNWVEAVTETALIIVVGTLISLVISYATRELAEEQQDRKRQKLFSDIFISESPTLFFAISPDGKILSASRSLLERIGYTIEDIQGKDYLSAFIFKQDHESVSDIVKKLLDTNTPTKNETCIVSRNGKIINIEWEGRVAYSSDGEVEFIYGSGTDITERKQTELALKLSEERYRSFIQNLQGIAYRADMNNIPVFLHGDVEQITGYSEEDLLSGKSLWDDLVLSEDKDQMKESIEKLKTQGNFATELIYRIKRRDGRICWIRDNIQNICDDSGKPESIQGIVYDITSIKEAEASLRRSDERYRLLADNVKDVIWVLDKNLNYTYISPSVEKMRGYTVEEAMILPLDTIFTGRSYRYINKLIPEVFALQEKGEIPNPNRSLTFESELVCKDGSYIWVEVTASFAFDSHGNPVGFVGVTRDISERKKAEESIRQREETYRTIFENTGTAMIIIEDDTTISLVNDEFGKLTGYTRDEVEGKKSWVDFIVPEDMERLLSCHNLRKTNPEAAPKKYDFRFQNRQGLTNNAYATVTVIPGTQKAVVSLLDISETKKASEELRVSREQLRNLHKHSQDVRERERTRVAREIHDELGQVLTALKMDLSYLAKKLPQDLPALRTKTNLMLRFVDMTIQSVKRITMDLRPGLLDHLGLVAAIEWQAEEFQKRTGIRYCITVDPEEISLNPDRSTSIFRIFQETLTNIARHAHATEIKISLLEKEGILELTVSDNGIGISKDQIDNSKSFGLLGIKERAYFSGGQAKIYGHKGKGTTVQVLLPLDQMRVLDDTSAYC